MATMPDSATKHIAALEKDLPEWRDVVISLYNEGASDREIMRALGITTGVWKKLYNATIESDFRELINYGKMVAQAWWEMQGRKNINNKQFNTSLWSFQMKNRYGWAERSETSATTLDLSNESDEQLINRIEELNKRMGMGRDRT